MDRQITIEDFVMDGVVLCGTYGMVCKESDGTCFNLNRSNILSTLIKEAALCERFASDLFIDWMKFERRLKEVKEACKFQILFGFRKTGVDDTNEVLLRANTEYNIGETYRAVYKLCVDVNDFDDYEETTAEISLCKCRLSEEVL